MVVKARAHWWEVPVEAKDSGVEVEAKKPTNKP